MITEDELESLVKEGMRIKDVFKISGAGTSCGTCREYVIETVSDMTKKHNSQIKAKLKKEKYIRVMFDYNTSALWDKDGLNCEYGDFPISIKLTNAFKQWTDTMDKKLWYWDSSSKEGLKGVDENVIIDLAAEGKTLAIELKRELADWTIVYFDDSKMSGDITQPREEFEYEITLEDL